MDKEYVVTLYRKEDLEQFYKEMQLSNFPLAKKRPISRSTHYMMTEEQAERLRQDPRVWGVEEVDRIKFVRQTGINNESYVISGQFNKSGGNSSSYKQWGQIHCAGTQAQRNKNQFGVSGSYTTTNDSVDVFNNGRHVDVVLVDDPISYDSKEWESPSQPGVSRFVQYQWFNELNAWVSGPDGDDDGQTLPTGTITYGTNAATPQYHGNHVAGTACGQWYGWANEANIYNIAVTDTWPSGQSIGGLLIHDYLRAFHLNKPINPATGKRNPTITNHSYGSIYDIYGRALQLSDIDYVEYRQVQYSASNPGPSGWTQSGVETDFGVRFIQYLPAYSAAIAADVQDAIEDGIVMIGAAGNDNMYVDVVDGPDWNNKLGLDAGYIWLNRGAAPNSPDSGAISVGALDYFADFRRTSFSQFGPGVDVFAPGREIASSYGNTGFTDTKYGSGNYYQTINGTSMASPQVCGIIACVANSKERFSQNDARAFIEKYSIDGEMSFDLFGGGFDDSTSRMGSPNKVIHIENTRSDVGYISRTDGRRSDGLTFPRSFAFYTPPPSIEQTTYTFTVTNNGSASWLFTGSDAQNTYSNNSNVTIYCSVGDILEFNVNASGHPFWIKTQPQTGTGFGVTTGTITGQATQVGTVTWDTTGVTATSYHIMCQFHSSMRATIIIS
jgi:hypothetical protein